MTMWPGVFKARLPGTVQAELEVADRASGVGRAHGRRMVKKVGKLLKELLDGIRQCFGVAIENDDSV